MERVLVIGCSGSGKSTFARRLATKTGLPLIHLDQHYFEPDWTEISGKKWTGKVGELIARPRWIMDGNYTGTLAERLEAADTVFFIDLPTWLCLWRVFSRTLRYWKQRRPSSAPGCHERFDWGFLVYIAGYRKRSRPRVLHLLSEASHVEVNHFTSPSEVRRFLANLPA